MLFKKLAEYVMRGRKEAAVMAMLWTIVPLMGWLGASIMALITLRKGALEGFVILLWTALPCAVVAFLGYPDVFFYGIIAGNFIVWIMAIVLRETVSWDKVILASTMLGIIAVLLAHLFIGNITDYWYKVFQIYYAEAKADLTLPVIAGLDLQTVLRIMATFATGLQAMFLLLMNLIILGIARWLQSLLYNPDGFTSEIYALRLGYLANILLLVFVIFSVLGYHLAWDVMPVILLPFFVCGLSLIHALLARTSMMWLWTFSFYLLLILFFQYLAFVVILAAIVDSWVDIRERISQKSA